MERESQLHDTRTLSKTNHSIFYKYYSEECNDRLDREWNSYCLGGCI